MSNLSIEERNRVVSQHLWCIDKIMRKNAPLIRAAGLDRDDVYQQLALRLIKAVESFDPEKGELRQHILAQLQFEMLNCKRPYRTTGITGAPADFRQSKVISIEAARESTGERWELLAA